MIPPTARRMPDGRRLHLQHGPMDLVVHATGPAEVVGRAEAAAIARFETILEELVPQLDVLRAPLGAEPPTVHGSVAPRMLAAAGALPGLWTTPMIAVAGSVADEVLAALVSVDGLRSAYVNNGGDLALHLVDGERLRVGVVADLAAGRADQVLEVSADRPVRGLATSGAGGRSHSLGIADAVTVLATCAAAADAAATLVANAVDLPDAPTVARVPACELDPDSDLGDQLVTVEVGPLDPDDVEAALDRGAERARDCLAANPDLLAAVLHLRGRQRVVGDGHLARLEPVGERPARSGRPALLARHATPAKEPSRA